MVLFNKPAAPAPTSAPAAPTLPALPAPTPAAPNNALVLARPQVKAEGTMVVAQPVKGMLAPPGMQ